MKSRKSQLLFLTCLAFVAGIFLMITINGNAATINQPDPRNEELIRSINTLEAEIAQMETEAVLINQQISDIHSEQSEGQTRLSYLGDELATAQINACLTKLQGPGIILTVDDNKTGAEKAKLNNPDNYNPEQFIVHDKDLLYMVHAIAPYSEAIAINGIRLHDTYNIRCVGTVILVNSARLAPPYTISAIGDAELLKAALQQSSRYQTLYTNGLPLKITEEDNLIINNYTGSYTYNYSKITP